MTSAPLSSEPCMAWTEVLRSIVQVIFRLELSLSSRPEGSVASFLDVAAAICASSFDLRELFGSLDDGIVRRARFSVPRLPDTWAAAHAVAYSWRRLAPAYSRNSFCILEMLRERGSMVVFTGSIHSSNSNIVTSGVRVPANKPAATVGGLVILPTGQSSGRRSSQPRIPRLDISHRGSSAEQRDQGSPKVGPGERCLVLWLETQPDGIRPTP